MNKKYSVSGLVLVLSFVLSLPVMAENYSKEVHKCVV
jgi:hypothetical protein